MKFLQFVVKSKYKRTKIGSTTTNVGLFITPSKKSVDRHFTQVREVLHRCTSAQQVVDQLNPIIRGWVNYAKYSTARTAKQVGHWNKRLYLRLSNWVKRTFGTRKRLKQVWTTKGGDRWRFYYSKPNGQLVTLYTYGEGSYALTKYVAVQSQKTPYDGDVKYWSKRLKTYVGASQVHAKILDRQKSNCGICGVPFLAIEDTIYHIDHRIRSADGGTNQLSNLQAVHIWCHEGKTAKENRRIRSDREQNSPDLTHP
jgi:RNA-directed DNA polymerase